MENLAELFDDLLSDLTDQNGVPQPGRFRTEEELGQKISEYLVLLAGLAAESRYLRKRFENDANMRSPDLDVRVRTLATYCKATSRLLNEGVLRSRGSILPSPDFVRLTASIPGLGYLIDRRWEEVQVCQNTGAYLAAIVLMGSLLESLLLARATRDPGLLERSKYARRNGGGELEALENWHLHDLLRVSYDLRWIKSSPSEFHELLRKFRSLIHPWSEATLRQEWGGAACAACWRQLNSAVEDLLDSLN